MIPKYLSAIWATIAPTLGNHLWQSTLFVIAAGLLTLILRRNHARSRYWLWLAASLKFLIPFSLLAGIGSYLVWPRGPAGTETGLYFAAQEIGQPFTQSTMPSLSPIIPPANPSAFFPALIHLLPAFLVAVWLCGFLVVLFVWFVRWRRVSETLRDAIPLRRGREVEALRRLESIAGIRKRIEVRLSTGSLEPGIFGIARPVLVWPAGLSERLEDAHVEAVLAHEIRHVRRRDNLVAAIHMVVEAIFWFYPLVWWMGARMVEERERACDEEVLELGSERQAYAESILKICEFCVGSPLACMSGVTGADLKRRIVQIMTGAVARKLDFRRKLLLGATGLLAVAAPIVFGQVKATQNQPGSQDQGTAAVAPAPVFEVALIKPDKPAGMGRRVMFGMRWSPDGLTTTGTTLQALIRLAYRVQEPSQIIGGPSWIKTERYDIQAKVDESVADELGKLTPEQGKPVREHMLQALLADRFKLTVHHETKELPVYALVIAKNGLKIRETKPDENYSNGIKGEDGHALGKSSIDFGRGRLRGQGVPIAGLVQLLSQQPELEGRVVLDRTELTGEYDFTLQWAPENLMLNGTRPPDNAALPDSSGPSLFTALQEQLGLKLESTKGPVDALVIDHVEHPSEN